MTKMCAQPDSQLESELCPELSGIKFRTKLRAKLTGSLSRLPIRVGLLLVLLASTLSAFAAEYHVATTGSDGDSGDAEHPFQNIQRAADVMIAGDTCVIHDGTYREQVTPSAHHVSFVAAPDETVVVSGFEPVTGWDAFSTTRSGTVYRADLGRNDIGDRNQVLYNGQMMNLARWPNKTNLDPFDLEAPWATGTDTSLTHPDIPDWSWSSGGVVFFLGRNRWTSWRRPITSSAAGVVYFDALSGDWQYGGSHHPENGGEFYLMNILEALDAGGEWYIDRVANQVYLQTPGDEDPDVGTVLVRARTKVFNLSGKTGVILNGLQLEGGSVDLKSATGCVVKNCCIYYGNHTIASASAAFVGDASVEMNSSSANCRISRNDIQWGAGNGIVLKGNETRVDNNHIGNFSYLASYACPVELRGRNHLTRNEIFNAGRDCIRGGGEGSQVAYNDIHHSNIINDDCGGIYFCCGTYDLTRIHHNWIHDIHSRDEHIYKYKGTGVYLDNSTKQVIVDHNVMWNLEWACIQINWEGEDLLIYNNTLWSIPEPKSKAMGRWVNGYDIINVPVYNSLVNSNEIHSTDEQNTVVYDMGTDPFEDYANRDFVPREGTAPVDAGRLIPGYTDDYVGAAPDVGAYERGGVYWLPGPDWAVGQDVSDELYRPLVGLFLALGPGTVEVEELSDFTDYRIEWSRDNMASWEPVHDFTAPYGGAYTFEDVPRSENVLFYRVVELLPTDPPYTGGPQSGVMAFDDFIGDPHNTHVSNGTVISEGLPSGVTATVAGDSNGFGVGANAVNPLPADVPILFVYGEGSGTSLQFSQDVTIPSFWTAAASWALGKDPGGEQRITGQRDGAVVWTYTNTTAHTDFWEVIDGAGQVIDELVVYPQWIGIDNVTVETVQ